MDYSNDIEDIYKNTEDYNPNIKQKRLIVFDDITTFMLINKNINLLVTELCIRGRKLNISFISSTQSYFTVPKNIRLSSTHYFVVQIPTKRELKHNARFYESL